MDSSSGTVHVVIGKILLLIVKERDYTNTKVESNYTNRNSQAASGRKRSIIKIPMKKNNTHH